MSDKDKHPGWTAPGTKLFSKTAFEKRLRKSKRRRHESRKECRHCFAMIHSTIKVCPHCQGDVSKR